MVLVSVTHCLDTVAPCARSRGAQVLAQIALVMVVVMFFLRLAIAVWDGLALVARLPIVLELQTVSIVVSVTAP